MPGCLYALPSKNKAPSATMSWAVGTANAAFPLTNVVTLEPDTPAKANETTATLRATFGGAQALEGVALFNVNFPGLSVDLTNNGGMATQSRTVPNPEDGVTVNVWWDLREVASASATQWNIVVTGAPTAVAIGTLVLIESWTEMRIRWEYDLSEIFPVISKRTALRKRLQYRIPVRYRRMKALPFLAEDRNAIRTLRRSTLGSITPWPLIPDFEDVDALLVQFADEEHPETYTFVSDRFDDATARGIVDMPITVEEVSSGVAL